MKLYFNILQKKIFPVREVSEGQGKEKGLFHIRVASAEPRVHVLKMEHVEKDQLSQKGKTALLET